MVLQLSWQSYLLLWTVVAFTATLDTVGTGNYLHRTLIISLGILAVANAYDISTIFTTYSLALSKQYGKRLGK